LFGSKESTTLAKISMKTTSQNTLMNPLLSTTKDKSAMIQSNANDYRTALLNKGKLASPKELAALFAKQNDSK